MKRSDRGRLLPGCVLSRPQDILPHKHKHGEGSSVRRKGEGWKHNGGEVLGRRGMFSEAIEEMMCLFGGEGEINFNKTGVQM